MLKESVKKKVRETLQNWHTPTYTPKLIYKIFSVVFRLMGSNFCVKMSFCYTFH